MACSISLDTNAYRLTSANKRQLYHKPIELKAGIHLYGQVGTCLESYLKKTSCNKNCSRPVKDHF